MIWQSNALTSQQRENVKKWLLSHNSDFFLFFLQDVNAAPAGLEDDITTHNICFIKQYYQY